MSAAHPSYVSLAPKEKKMMGLFCKAEAAVARVACGYLVAVKPHAHNHCTPLLPANYPIPQAKDKYTNMTYSAKRTSLGVSGSISGRSVVSSPAPSISISSTGVPSIGVCLREIRHADDDSVDAITKGSMRKRVKLCEARR